MHTAMPAGKHIFNYRQFAKKPDALKSPGNSEFNNAMRPQTCNIAAFEINGAVFRFIISSDAIEYCGFTGSIRANKPDNAPLVHAEAQIIHGNQSAKDLGHIMQSQ